MDVYVWRYNRVQKVPHISVGWQTRGLLTAGGTATDPEIAGLKIV